MRGFYTGFSGRSNSSQPSSPFEEIGIREDDCYSLDCDSPCFSVRSDSYFQIEPAGPGAYGPITSFFNQVDGTIIHSQTPETERIWRDPPTNGASPDNDNFSIMDLPSPGAGCDGTLITNSISPPPCIADPAAWIEDMDFHMFGPTSEQPQLSDGSNTIGAAYPSEPITRYYYSTRDALEPGAGLGYNCQLSLSQPTPSEIYYMDEYNIRTDPNGGTAYANGGLLLTQKLAPTALRSRRNYPRSRKRPSTGRKGNKEPEGCHLQHAKPGVRVSPQSDLDIAAGATGTDFCAKCLFPGCENVMWGTTKKKASDNLLQSHQKKVHPQWWKYKPVDDRCAVSKHMRMMQPSL